MSDLDSFPDTYSTRMLDVEYSSWRHSITIFDSTTEKPVYKLSRGDRSGCFTIRNADERVVATTRTSQITSKIVVEMITASGETNKFEIRNDGHLCMGSPAYVSPAFGGQEVTWKNKLMSSKILYTLIEGKGMAHAKFESNWRTKIGRLEIVNAVAKEDKFDEIAAVLLTLLRRKLKSINDATIVAIT